MTNQNPSPAQLAARERFKQMVAAKKAGKNTSKSSGKPLAPTSKGKFVPAQEQQAPAPKPKAKKSQKPKTTGRFGQTPMASGQVSEPASSQAQAKKCQKARRKSTKPPTPAQIAAREAFKARWVKKS